MTASTCSRMLADTSRPASTRDTVIFDTPASRATSAIVGMNSDIDLTRLISMKLIGKRPTSYSASRFVLHAKDADRRPFATLIVLDIPGPVLILLPVTVKNEISMRQHHAPSGFVSGPSLFRRLRTEPQALATVRFSLDMRLSVARCMLANNVDRPGSVLRCTDRHEGKPHAEMSTR